MRERKNPLTTLSKGKQKNQCWCCCSRRSALLRFASHVLRSLRRSSSPVPPHTPDSWFVASANSKHGSSASHSRHTFLADSIWWTAPPVLPIGKKSSGSTLRHAALSRQSSASQSTVRFQVRAISSFQTFNDRGLTLQELTTREEGCLTRSLQRRQYDNPWAPVSFEHAAKTTVVSP